MLREICAVALAATLCSACAGPLISQRVKPSDNATPYSGTMHGLYCLPKRLHKLKVEQTDGTPGDAKAEYTISLTETTVPDWEEVYRLGLSEDILSKYKMTVTYEGAAEKETPSCLLKSISSDVTDETAEAVSLVTETVFKAVTGGSLGITTQSEGERAAQKRTFGYILDLDPMNLVVQQSAVNGALKQAHFPIEVQLSLLAKRPNAGAFAINRSDTGEEFGVVARPFQPYKLSFLLSTPDDKRLIDEQVVYAPNGMSPYLISIDRAAFAQRLTTIDFVGGQVTKIETDKKDSEAVGFLGIPLDIVTAIVSAPAAAFKSDQAEVDAQKNLIESQTNLIKAQQGLIDQQKKKSEEPPGP